MESRSPCKEINPCSIVGSRFLINEIYQTVKTPPVGICMNEMLGIIIPRQIFKMQDCMNEITNTRLAACWRNYSEADF